MVTILLAVLLPITNLLTGLLIVRAYNSGLRHNYDLKHDIKPKEEATIQQVINSIYEKKTDDNYSDVVSEWLYGEDVK